MRIQRGFTLLELLVATAIFAVMAAMAYAGLDSVLNARHEVAQRSDRLAALQTADLFLQRDITQVVDRGIRDAEGGQLPALSGGSELPGQARLSFTRGGRPNPAGLPRSSLERIDYRMENDTLYRDRWPVLDRAQGTEPLRAALLSGVTAFRVRFLDVNGNWAQDWPPPGTPTAAQSPGGLAPETPLPRAVEVTLDLKEGGSIKRLFVLPQGTPWKS